MVVCVVVTFDSGIFQGSVHAFDLAVCPWMARLGEAMLDASLLTGIIEGMNKI